MLLEESFDMPRPSTSDFDMKLLLVLRPAIESSCGWNEEFKWLLSRPDVKNESLSCE